LNEVNATVTRTKWFIENVEQALKPQIVFNEGGMTEMIVREPLGIVANISAWNYPFFVGTNVLVPALLTGNSVLYKPSEFSSLTGINMVEMLHQAGFDQAVQIVIGGGQVGAHILKAGINGVFFTGSYPTGKKIAETVASDLIKVQLELGGKDPVYVHNDVDVKNAAEGLADGAMYNAGQSCCSVERIYVHQSIGKQFIDEFVKTVDSFKIGDPADKGTYIGPLARAAQMDVLDAQVKDALAKGAKLLRGGKRVVNSPGNYYEPTVLVNVNNSMEVMKEESFGPIIGIQEVSSPEEATALMNHSVYGLTAGVYAKDERIAMEVLSNVSSGTAYWNCCDRVSPRLPWSGRGHSGVGLTLALEGITTFTQPKSYHLRK
jgi:acyl-CoA reductase-like NAD-dependent aldehyde dehydrogenase